MKIISYLFFIFLIIILGLGTFAFHFRKSLRPNVVLIIVDTLRADKLGCYGFPANISPEIDKIAKEGIQFNNVIAQSSWTRPSIGSMLTSLYPRTLGIYKEKFDTLSDRYLTIPEILKANGYTTFGITANPNINKFFNFNQGFDEYIDSHVIWRWMKPENGKIEYTIKKLLNKSVFQDNDLVSRLVKEKVLTKLEFYHYDLVVFNIMNEEQLKNRLDQIGISKTNLVLDAWRYSQKENVPASSQTIFQKVIKTIQSKTLKSPAYIQINIMEMHNPRHMLRPEFKKNFLGLKEEEISYYHDAVKQVSYDINQFIDQVLAIPSWKDTLFIITSDHGEGLNDHPSVDNSRYHGHILYKSQLKVPLILYHPPNKNESAFTRWLRKQFPQSLYSLKNKKSKKIEEPVRLLDLMPTLLDYLKIPIPSKIEGKSLMKLIYEEKTSIDLPPYFVAETAFRGTEKIAAYSKQWEYIENLDGHKGVNKYELQPIGTTEDGKVTDKIKEEEKIALTMKNFIQSWTKRHPKIKALPPNEKLSKEETNQLKSLGYL